MTTNILTIKTREKTRQQLMITVLFSVLPLIDSFNGLLDNMPIGIVYKASLCLIMFLLLCTKGKFLKKYSSIMLVSVGYVILSMLINMSIGGRIGKSEFPIKLLFNIVLFSLMVMCIKKRIILPETIYSILNYTSWVFIFCFLVPYVLGMGCRVYGGDTGYKAFFISQNELSLLVAVSVFVTAYGLTYQNDLITVLKLGLISLCGMLLNTKVAILSCLIAIFLWLTPMIIKGSTKVKVFSFLTVALGFIALRGRVLNALMASWNRYSILITKHYDGSKIAGLLSGRNFSLAEAINEYRSNHQFLRFLFGNGFCSETLIEMDLFDIFFYLGMIGLIGAIVYLFAILKRTIRNSKNDKTRLRPISFVVIMIILTMAGHVLFMSMSGCYFILYACFLMYYENNIRTYMSKGHRRW